MIRTYKNSGAELAGPELDLWLGQIGTPEWSASDASQSDCLRGDARLQGQASCCLAGESAENDAQYIYRACARVQRDVRHWGHEQFVASLRRTWAQVTRHHVEARDVDEALRRHLQGRRGHDLRSCLVLLGARGSARDGWSLHSEGHFRGLDTAKDSWLQRRGDGVAFEPWQQIYLAWRCTYAFADPR